MSRKETDQKKTRFAEGSGNVFADIGILNPEEALAKARLADIIAQALEDRGMTQAQAGAFLGIDQGSVSKLVNGRLDGFSQERLIRYLNALGSDVEIIVRFPSAPGSRGSLRVGAG